MSTLEDTVPYVMPLPSMEHTVQQKESLYSSKLTALRRQDELNSPLR